MSGELDPFDPKSLAIPAGMTSTVLPSKQVPRHLKGEKFLRGPIPLQWIEAASALPGKALAIGIRLWFESGCRNGCSTVPLNLTATKMPRRSAQRALQALVNARLVSVEHRKGRPALVTLLSSGREVPPRPEF